MLKRLLLTSLLVLPLIAADRVKEDAKDDDAKKMQGDWVITAMERDGKEAPLPPEEKRNFKIDGDKMAPAGEKAATFKLGTDKKLKTIDITPPDDKKIVGVYELDGDTLKICLSKPGTTDRPTDLSSKGERMLVTMKRKK